jgi:hypothetical protein
MDVPEVLTASNMRAVTIETTIVSLLSFIKEKYRLMATPSCLCVSPLLTFETVGRFFLNSVGRSCNHSKMADIQSFEVDAKQRNTVEFCILIDL